MSAKQHYEVHGVLEKPLAPELSLAGKHLESRTEDLRANGSNSMEHRFLYLLLDNTFSNFKTASTQNKKQKNLHSITFWLLEQDRLGNRNQSFKDHVLSLIGEDIYNFTLFLLQELLRTRNVLTPIHRSSLSHCLFSFYTQLHCFLCFLL